MTIQPKLQQLQEEPQTLEKEVSEKRSEILNLIDSDGSDICIEGSTIEEIEQFLRREFERQRRIYEESK